MLVLTSVLDILILLLIQQNIFFKLGLQIWCLTGFESGEVDISVYPALFLFEQ